MSNFKEIVMNLESRDHGCDGDLYNTKNLQNKEMKELYHLTIYNSSNVLPRKKEKKRGSSTSPLCQDLMASLVPRSNKIEKQKIKKRERKLPYDENS